MLFNFALSSVLFASAVLADRHPENNRSGFLNSDEKFTNAASNKIIYDINWAGAILDESNGTFTVVTGTFTVPNPTGHSDSAAAAWVGIDGFKCNSLFHAGVNFVVTDKGPSYNAWYEWFPAYPQNFSGLSITAGDVIKLSVIASSATSGIAKIENLSNGQFGVELLQSTHALCGQSAEWVVEDYRQGGNGNFVPFATFGTVTFKDAVAIGPNGAGTPEEATIVEIKQNNMVMTSVSTNANSVTIQRV